MSDEEVIKKISKFKKVDCPLCNTQLNLRIKENKKINFKISEADVELWCRHCQRYIKFSLNNNE